MRLRQLKILLAIVENGLNITAAADKLFTSQPGVSKQLKLLEEELGLKLFTRKGKSLESITPEGEEVVRRAQAILSEVRAIQDLSGQRYEQEDGTLAIATTHTQARYVLPEIISRFRERYPGVRLDLHQGTTEQIAGMAAERQVNFAIATGSQHLFPNWALLPCYRWDRNVIVPSGHPLASRNRPPTLAELAEYPLVTYVFSSSGESSFKRAFAEAGLEPKIAFTARDADVIKTYVRMGLGVGVVASMAARCEEGDLVALDGTGLFPRVTTWLGFPRDLLWRRYMYEFAEQFAPQWSPRQITKALACATQEEIAALVPEDELPLRNACGEVPAPAAS
jgi:LysR family cys regulon transcriptional activator